MSYYLDVTVELNINTKKISAKGLTELYEDRCKRDEKFANDCDGWKFEAGKTFDGRPISYVIYEGEGGRLGVAEGEEIIKLIAPYVEKGVIECRGEDDIRWEYAFDGEGGYETKDGIVTYDIFESFMDEYECELPKKLVDDLKKFKTTTRI